MMRCLLIVYPVLAVRCRRSSPSSMAGRPRGFGCSGSILIRLAGETWRRYLSILGIASL